MSRIADGIPSITTITACFKLEAKKCTFACIHD